MTHAPGEHELCACVGKRRLSCSRAWKIAKRMARVYRVGMSAYHCRFCGHWHVGGKKMK